VYKENGTQKKAEEEYPIHQWPFSTSHRCFCWANGVGSKLKNHD